MVEADSILEVFSQTTGKYFSKNVVVFLKSSSPFPASDDIEFNLPLRDFVIQSNPLDPNFVSKTVHNP